MDDTTKKELQSAAFERLIHHLRERTDVQNIDLMNLAGFCRNCLSKWYREEAQKKELKFQILMQESMFMACLMMNGKKSFVNNYFSLSLGNNSTKLQGL